MGHGHPHPHDARSQSYGRAFLIGFVLNLIFIVVEIVYGVIAHSMALIGDAGHNVTDVLGLALAWGAAVLARRPPSSRRTYGLRRISILAALGNALLLVAATGAVAWESIGRLADPGEVKSGTVIAVAAVGVLINGLGAFLLRGSHDLNVRGAFLHLAADAAASLGVVITGVVIGLTGWTLLDPIVGLALALLILAGTWSLLRHSLDLALDAVPRHIDPEQVRAYLSTLPGVCEVHDLHIWAMSTTENALTAHLVMAAGGREPGSHAPTFHAPDFHAPDFHAPDFHAIVSQQLHARFAIEHVTLQIETRHEGADPCRLASDKVV